MRTIIVCLALFLVCTQAVNVHKTLTNSQVKRMDGLKKGSSWGSFLMNLAEMHTLAQGPLDELIVAIQEVISDVEVKTERAHHDFDVRTQQHQTDVRRFTDLISEANRNVAETHELIDNILIPQKDQLNEEIVTLNRQITESEAHIVSSTEARRLAHEEFLVRQEEHAAALEAIAEALQVLSQLEGDSSLIQVKKAEKSITKVKRVFSGKKNVQSSFVKALLQMTTEGFTDSSALQRVFVLLRQIEADLSTSQQNEAATEAQAQADFEADIARTRSNIAAFTAELQTTQEELTRTEEQIINARQYIEQREFDRAGYQADLDEENASYERATAVYEDLIAQLESEGAACSEALDVVSNASIDDYIGDRMSQTSDNVIGQGGQRSTASLGADII